MTENPQKDAKAQLKAAKAYAKASRPWYKMKRTWAAGIVALVVIGSLLSQGGSGTTAAPAPGTTTSAPAAGEAASKPAAAEKAKPLVISSNKLLDDLDSNALKAANIYKDKYVQVKGKVVGIDSSGNYFSVGRTDDEMTFINVTMNIEDEHRAKVAEFDDEEIVTVTGTITDVGEVLGYTVDVESIA